MSEVCVIGLGGAGVENIKLYTEMGVFKNVNKFYTLDTSDANRIESELVTNVRLKIPKAEQSMEFGIAEGSGGDRGKHVKEYPEFLKKFLAENELGRQVILVYSVSGGTGSGMGPILHRLLLEAEIPTISITIGDTGSIKEATNTVSGLLSLNQQTSTGNPVIFQYYDNSKNDVTQGDINMDITCAIDTLSILFHPDNSRIDRTDIKNFFFFNKVVRATPVLTELEILNQNTILNYTKTPVAALALYKDPNSIKQEFPKLLYRKVGVFSEKLVGKDNEIDFIYAVLDHGDTLRKLQLMISDRKQENDSVVSSYQSENSLLDESSKSSLGFIDLDM